MMSKPAEVLKNYQGKGLFLFIFILLAVVNITVFLDIPFLGQFSGFIFLSFIPGILILLILKLNRLGMTEKVVLSVGLSISSILFFGLIINWLYPILGNKTPLSVPSLVVSFTILTVVLAALAFWKNRQGLFPLFSGFRLNTSEMCWLLVPALFPLLSILGMQLLNMTENNTLLMALFFLILGYVILIAVRNRHFPQKVYAPTILFISISLSLLYLLRCPHIMGADIHAEYYLFNLTANLQHWQRWGEGPLDGCLTISLLPAIYQSFVHIDPEYLYKIIYNFLLCLTPLAVYIISRRYVGDLMAFLAAFFFMSQLTFVQSAGDARNNSAIFFFALAVMVLNHERLRELDKRLLFLIFGTTIIVSHYATAYIFVIILFLTWFSRILLTKIVSLRMRRHDESEDSVAGGIGSASVKPPSLKNPAAQKLLHNNYITFGISACLLFILFLWYSVFTGAAFARGVIFINHTFQQLHQFFIMEARTGLLYSAVGSTIISDPAQVPKYMEMIFSWLTIILIAIGVLTILSRYLSRHIRSLETKPPLSPPVADFDTEYVIIALVCCCMIAITVLLPYVSQGYDLIRVYFMMMVVLAPFFVIGGVTLARLVGMRWAYLVILAVLVPYFLCTTGTIYQALGAPKVMILSSQSLGYDLFYVHDQDTRAAKWLGQNKTEGITTYSFGHACKILMSQGGLPRSATSKYLYHMHQKGEEISGYVYLIYPNVVREKVSIPSYRMVDIEPYKDMLNKKDKIYTNNASEIYR